MFSKLPNDVILYEIFEYIIFEIENDIILNDIYFRLNGEKKFIIFHV